MSSFITARLQNELMSMVALWTTMKEEASDIYKGYWATDANTTVGALSPGTAAATLATKLTKDEYIAGITMVEDIEDFFGNQPVSTTDYLATCEKLRYGSAATPTKTSEATEGLGDRMYQVALNCITLFGNCNTVLEMYFANEVNDQIANLDNERNVTGSNMTKKDLADGIVLVEQFKKMLNNEAVAAADYAATLGLWQKFSSE